MPTELREAQASSQRHTDIAILESEHQVLDEIWHQVEPWLESVEKVHKVSTPQRLSQFVAIYEGHMQREQNKVFPYASLLTATQRQQICLQMARRRGLKT